MAREQRGKLRNTDWGLNFHNASLFEDLNREESFHRECGVRDLPERERANRGREQRCCSWRCGRGWPVELAA